MKPISRQILVVVLLGMFYVFLFSQTSHRGFWTADNGLKYLAIRSQVLKASHPISIPLSGTELDPWKEAIPLIPPFVSFHHDKIIPVFSPLFVVMNALGWKLFGEWVLWWIPLLAALGLLVVMWWGFRIRDDGLIGGPNEARPTNSMIGMLLLALTSPLLFYALNLWEYTTSMLCLIGGMALTWAGYPKTDIRPYAWFLGGVLLGTAGMFRLESWVVAVSWLIVSFWDRRQTGWVLMLLGMMVAFLFWIVTNFWWTGSWLPIQFSENWMAYVVPGTHSPVVAFVNSRWNNLVNLIFSAHPKWWVNLLLNFGFVGGILSVLMVKRPSAVKMGYGLMIVSYLVFLILEISDKHPVASTAFTGGLLWCCPWVVFAFPIGENKSIKRLLVTILLSIGLIILITPISQGIHFGPRILLGVIPLLAVMASRNLKPLRLEQGWRISMWVLIFLSILHQDGGIQVLTSQKNLDSVLNSQVRELKEEVIITDLWWMPCDLARAWENHSFFLVYNTEVFRDLLFHMKASGINEFAFISESPNTLANANLPIHITKGQLWKYWEGSSPVIEHGVLSDDSLQWADLFTEVGLWQLQKGFPERALGPFQAEVDWNPGNADGWYNLGMVKYQMGNTVGAQEAFEAAINIEPNHQNSVKMLRELENRP